MTSTHRKCHKTKSIRYMKITEDLHPGTQFDFREVLIIQFNYRYKKTHETLSQAGMKASAAITNVGSAIGKKLGDMRYVLQYRINILLK